MSSVGTTIRDEPMLAHIQSILEFGSADGSTYRTLHPRFYLGIDSSPTWQPNNIDGVRVMKCDVRTWRPEIRNGISLKYELVICDAHGSIDDPEVTEVTEAQVKISMECVEKHGFIAVDDCWFLPIGRAALTLLGDPTHIAVYRPGFWIWRR